MVVLVGAVLSACGGTTTFTASYRPPTAEPLNLKGEKVAAVVLMQNQSLRRTAEDLLAKEITEKGAQGLPMYTILPNATAGDEAAARAEFERIGVKGVVVMRPRRVNKETYIPPAKYYGSPAYLGYWGGYYPYGWDNTWSDPISSDRVTHGVQPLSPYSQVVAERPGFTQVEEVTKVEILIYSLKQNQLVWAGEAEVADHTSVESVVHSLVEGTADELRGMWLVPS